MRRRCCPDCFDDRGLRNHIIPSLDPVVGNCDFCGSRMVSLVEPNSLREIFEQLVSVYEPSVTGKTLVEWLKEDWQLFTHPKMDVPHAKDLLGEVLDDGQVVRQIFAPSAEYKSEALAKWETLRDELMYRNRYFLDEAIDTERLEGLLSFLPADDMPATWFRARVLNGDAPYSVEKMGAPPQELAKHGRANPPGIPYLYLGSTPETAVAEVRPHTGEIACVAEFEIGGPLRAVDLRNPRKLASPFALGETSAIGHLRADIAFLERLGEELTRPVLPSRAAVDYIPSQYLCEFIKKLGYDGVVYRSSVSNGMNLALFAPNRAVGGDVRMFKARVSIDVDAV